MSAHAPSPGPLDIAVLAVGAVVALAALLLNLIGGLAGALFGDGWVSVPLAEMPALAARLSSTASDPRAAWPPPVRGALPGAGGFVAVTVGLLVVVGSVAVVCAQMHRWRPRPTSARWARARDIRALRVHGGGRGRVVLGRLGRSLLAAEAQQSVLVVAPTQTGKTTGLAVPAILEWDGPVLATSVKSDLVRDTLGRRAELGEVMVFDPTAATGLDRASWTPLAQCRDWQSARRTAARLTQSAQVSRSGQEGEFWAQAGARFLAPLLLAAALSGRQISDVASWIDGEEQGDVLDALDGPKHEAARNAALAVWGADDRLRSSLYLTAGLALEAYNDPAVMACSSHADLSPDWLLDGGANTAYLCAPVDEQARLRPLFATLVREVVGEVYARANASGQPIDPPVLLVLDEAANVAPLPDLDQIASTAAGQGLQLVTVLQDLAQAHQRWGGRADTIVNNHRAKLFGAGISCSRTLEYVARVLGDTELQQRSETAVERGRRSVTRSSTFRPLAPPNALRERASGSMLLVYGSLPPAVVRPRLWYRDRALRRLARSGRDVEAQT